MGNNHNLPERSIPTLSPSIKNYLPSPSSICLHNSSKYCECVYVFPLTNQLAISSPPAKLKLWLYCTASYRGYPHELDGARIAVYTAYRRVPNPYCLGPLYTPSHNMQELEQTSHTSHDGRDTKRICLTSSASEVEILRRSCCRGRTTPPRCWGPPAPTSSLAAPAPPRAARNISRSSSPSSRP